MHGLMGGGGGRCPLPHKTICVIMAISKFISSQPLAIMLNLVKMCSELRLTSRHVTLVYY